MDDGFVSVRAGVACVRPTGIARFIPAGSVLFLLQLQAIGQPFRFCANARTFARFLITATRAAMLCASVIRSRLARRSR